MRHSAITLTMDTYGHLLPGEEAETIGRMPGFDRTEPLAQTGTADCCTRVSNRSAKQRDSVQSGAVGEGAEANADPIPFPVKSAFQATNRGSMRAKTPANQSTPQRTRTFDPLIKSQLLYRLS